jgi:hypothetical protein
MVDFGVVGFKCFLVHSGVDEFPCVDEKQVTSPNKENKQANDIDTEKLGPTCA